MTFLQCAEEFQAEAGEADVFRRGELLADAGRRERGGGGPEHRIALDNGDGAGEAFHDCEEIGHRGPHGRPADDHHVVIGRVHRAAL
jgi:hypothetical protein